MYVAINGEQFQVILRKKNIHCPECHKSGFKKITKLDVFNMYGDD